MNKEIKQLKVKDKWEKDFGILTFDIVKNKFHFKYDDNCNGYPFSDINIQNGKEFEQNTMFNVFSFDDSFARSKMIEQYNLSGKSDNEMQWFFKELCAKNNSLSCKGFYFEFRENTPCDFVKKVIDSMENFKLKKYL